MASPSTSPMSRRACLLPAVCLAPALLDAPVARLSSGERQRLALLRAVLQRPRFLLLDEPTAALDPHSRDQVEALLQRLKGEGMGLLLVSHDPAQAARLAIASCA
jgi:ABC-type multidrug transport system ATPase subunit